jgi:hypothetical protein
MKKALIYVKIVLLYVRYKWIVLVKNPVKTIWEWFGNLRFVYLTTRSEARIFSGYAHQWLAKTYADRRTSISCLNKYCGGKKYYVVPLEKNSVVVLDSTEINKLQAKGILKKSLNIAKLLEIAIYVSDNNPKKK